MAEQRSFDFPKLFKTSISIISGTVGNQPKALVPISELQNSPFCQGPPKSFHLIFFGLSQTYCALNISREIILCKRSPNHYQGIMGVDIITISNLNVDISVNITINININDNLNINLDIESKNEMDTNINSGLALGPPKRFSLLY